MSPTLTYLTWFFRIMVQSRAAMVELRESNP
jgi:hypothetical protein